MTVFIRPEFTPGTLLTYLGYHLQIFGSGRAKISLQVEAKKKIEFYTALPKRDRAGFERQKARSISALSDHFARVDQLLSDASDANIFRLYEKGNNNRTADNAHLVASMEENTLWLVMSGVVHQWELNTLLVHVLLEGKGKRKGEASIFNEYAPTQDHDWQDATFEMADYAKGFREGAPSSSFPRAPTAYSSKVGPPPSPVITQPAPKAKHCVQPAFAENDYMADDPYDDPIFFSDPPDSPPKETIPEQQSAQSWTTTSKGRSTLYGTDGLRAQLGV